MAHYIADALNRGSGPRAVIIPLQGFSMLNQTGKPLYDESANMAFVETMRTEHASDVELVEVDAHINADDFAQATVNLFLRLREQHGGKSN